MACGAPVIASKASIPEVAGDGSSFVDPLMTCPVEAMKEFLEDADLAASFREKGLKRVKAFSWEKTARQTIEVYKQCLS